MAIKSSDIRIGVEFDNNPIPLIVRRMNRHIVLWEVYSERNHIPKSAHTYAMTWQAWRAVKESDTTTPEFDAWAADIAEVFVCLQDGTRLTTDDNGDLVAESTGQRFAASEVDGIEGKPYPQMAGSVA